MKTLRPAILAAAMLLPSTAAHAHDVIDLARTAQNRLTAHHHIDLPFMIPRSIFTGFDGFASVEPGLQTLAEDDPSHGLFTLAAASHLQFELVSIDDGLIVWNDTGTAPMTPGQRFDLGSPFFHVHAIWQIPPTTGPGAYAATLILHDTSGLYASSEPFTITFARACAADLNADGFIDFADYLEFLSRYDASDESIDFNQDGLIDFADYLEFLDHYDAEC